MEVGWSGSETILWSKGWIKHRVWGDDDSTQWHWGVRKDFNAQISREWVRELSTRVREKSYKKPAYILVFRRGNQLYNHDHANSE